MPRPDQRSGSKLQRATQRGWAGLIEQLPNGPNPSRRQPETLMLKHSLLLGTVIVVLQLANPSWAQKPPAPAEADQPNPPYPGESHITFQWNYSCPGGHACSFRCPGAGGATSVTTLDIYLGVMPTGSDQHGLALFYNFVTQNIPRGNGFSVSNGTAILSCQVNGMRLDYSGPPK